MFYSSIHRDSYIFTIRKISKMKATITTTIIGAVMFVLHGQRITISQITTLEMTTIQLVIPVLDTLYYKIGMGLYKQTTMTRINHGMAINVLYNNQNMTMRRQ
jgi:hypothetical protein